jgi:hypothetical protein
VETNGCLILGIGEEVRKKGRTAGGGKVSMELMAKSTV